MVKLVEDILPNLKTLKKESMVVSGVGWFNEPEHQCRNPISGSNEASIKNPDDQSVFLSPNGFPLKFVLTDKAIERI